MINILIWVIVHPYLTWFLTFLSQLSRLETGYPGFLAGAFKALSSILTSDQNQLFWIDYHFIHQVII